MGVLDGRIAIVTGSDSGIGRAIAVLYAKEGADVVVTWHRDGGGARDTERQVRAARRRCAVLQVDVGDPASVEGLFDGTLRELGTPDLLVNNAGIDSTETPVAELPLEDWDRTLRINLNGPFYCSRRFVRLRRAAGGGGKIVNISSVHETISRPGGAAYDVAKGGLRNLTRTLALEVAPDRINVNAIAPGMVLTPMNQQAIDDPAARAEQERHIPLGRAGTPEEVAQLALYLA